MGAVLPGRESRQYPKDYGHLPKCGLQRHHRHCRSASVLSTNVRSRTGISAGALFVRPAVALVLVLVLRAAAAQVLRVVVARALGPQRLQVRHGTGSTAGACGTRGNISTICAKWSKAELVIKGDSRGRKTPGWRSSTAQTQSSCQITAGAQWITVLRRWRRCRRSWLP